MTPPAAAATARTRTRSTAPPPRRVSGPARPRRQTPAIAGPPPLALRLGGAVHGLTEHRLLDRLIRGRAWIAILGIGLIGIVFMQVSMLRMNAGIGRAVDTASRLERDNAALRATISEQSSGDHIEAEAARMGLVLPTDTPRFLDVRGFDPARAAGAITAPGAFSATDGTATTPTDTTAAALAPTGVAPSPDTTTAAPPATTTTATPTAAPTGATATTPSSTSTPTATSTAAPPTTSTPATSPTSTSQPVATAPPPAATGGASAAPTGH